MDGLTFVAELVKALAWPVGTVAVVLILRQHLYGAIDRIKSIKHGKTELSFAAELGRAQQVAEDAGVTIFRPASSFAPALVNLASASPHAAAMEGWQTLEAALRDLATRRGVRWSTPAKVVSELARAGVLANNLGSILQYLTPLGVGIARKEGRMSVEEALEFIMLSKSVTERIQRL